MIRRRAEGPRGRKLRAAADGHGDRPGRRDDQRHLHPHRHDQVRLRDRVQEVYKHTDVLITGAARSATNNGGERTEPPRRAFPESLLAQVRALPGVADGTGRGSRQRAAGGPRRQGPRRPAARPVSAFSVHPHGDQRFNPLTLVAAATGPKAPARSPSTTTPPARHNYKVGETIGVVARGPEQHLRDRRHRRDRRRRARSAAPRSRCSTSRSPSGCSTRRTSSTRSRSRPSSGYLPGAAGQGDQAPAPGQRPGADRQGPGGQAGDQRHQRLPRHRPGLPAGVRGHRPVRRQLRDRQHTVDHDRPANPRAGHAAHARRDPPPGAALGAARSARDRDCWRRSSACSSGSASPRG